MPKREPQAGDFFLLPYSGKRRDLLVKAIQPHPVGGGQWVVSYEDGRSNVVLLSSCRRVSPSEADRICKRGKYACGVTVVDHQTFSQKTPTDPREGG